MATTERFEKAVTKLYNAFHNNTLNAFDCRACAVGNICGGDEWSAYFGHAVQRNLDERMTSLYINERDDTYVKNGYNGRELLEVERLFLSEFIGIIGLKNKEMEFKGLCAVVEYLCELDGIANIMDYTALFETTDEKPKYELQF